MSDLQSQFPRPPAIIADPRQHAIDVQLLSIRMGAHYGLLALAGLVALHIAEGNPIGALAAIIAALFAYVNFTLIAGGAANSLINLAMVASIAFGVSSGLLVLF